MGKVSKTQENGERPTIAEKILPKKKNTEIQEKKESKPVTESLPLIKTTDLVSELSGVKKSKKKSTNKVDMALNIIIRELDGFEPEKLFSVLIKVIKVLKKTDPAFERYKKQFKKTQDGLELNYDKWLEDKIKKVQESEEKKKREEEKRKKKDEKKEKKE